MISLKKELNVFRTAVMFFTRIPVGKHLNYFQEYLNSSSKYLPVIGWLVGGASAGMFYVSYLVFPHSLAVLISMITSILATGAFHEDGFADACDGFGGGWSKEKILLIMKDSRIGAYGMIGMFFMLFSKYTALTELHVSLLPLVILTGHVISRFFAVLFIFTENYVREDETSKSKPVGKKIKRSEFMLPLLTAFVSFVLFPSYYYLLIIPLLFPVYYFFAKYIKKWIGGYTGDCLGAMQQVTELAFYLFVVMFEKISNVLI